MPVRKVVSAVVIAVTGLTVLMAALPSRVAQACLPCNCPTNTSLNCFGDYAVYTPVDRNDNCSILILDIERDSSEGKPKFAIRATATELVRLPEFPEENTLIDQYYEISLYKLTSGEYQVNVGPDPENKVFVLNFTGCPASNVYENTFVAERPAGE